MTHADIRHAIPDIDIRPLIFTIVLCMATIEFGQVWYFDAGQQRLITSRPFGGEYRALLWLSSLGAIALHLLRGHIGPLVAVLAGHLAFILWGAIVTMLWSVSLATSMRTLIFWGFAAGVASVAGLEIGQRLLARALGFLFVIVTISSLVLAVLVPSAGMAYWYDEQVVRGFFPQKNAFGWFTALGLLWFIWLRHLFPLFVVIASCGVLLVGLLLSGSAAALLICVAANLYLLWLRFSVTLFGHGARAFMATILLFVGGSLISIVILPVVFEALGRDLTLTGRTQVWAHYLSYIENRPLTGFGPGLFSGTSELAIAVGNTIPGFEGQGLFSTHSIYVSITGEAGPIGLIFFILGMLYLALIVPFRTKDPWSHLAAAMAFAILAIGVAETRDGYGPGLATILLLTARAQAIRLEYRWPSAD